MELAEKARKALGVNNYDGARQIYSRMKFEYYTLSSKDRKEMKTVMDKIYEKIQ